MEITQRYQFLDEALSLLREIARVNASGPAFWHGEIPYPHALTLRIGKSGELAMSTRAVLEELAGVDVRRIRGCPVCGRYFWAGRSDKTACSVPHSHALRMRKFRLNEKTRAAEELRRARRR